MEYFFPGRLFLQNINRKITNDMDVKEAEEETGEFADNLMEQEVLISALGKILSAFGCKKEGNNPETFPERDAEQGLSSGINKE